MDAFWVELAGDLDPDGFMNKADVRCGFTDIRYTYHIRSSSPEPSINEFIDFIGTKCPVGDSLIQGVKLSLADVVRHD
ncbi:OsmC family protein [Oceanisphaera pacifica]|uniref:OsmC family protein n=1 Tax=Oceanisphaera pacifica TaxID=2818389 RepID=A0ABS3NDW3_9GAMM|nr:OsmC family protein [Oceanisphaera pacifica]MBO1518476.1 OsmC family protein [Oceanisphaera pacifica]